MEENPELDKKKVSKALRERASKHRASAHATLFFLVCVGTLAAQLLVFRWGSDLFSYIWQDSDRRFIPKTASTNFVGVSSTNLGTNTVPEPLYNLMSSTVPDSSLRFLVQGLSRVGGIFLVFYVLQVLYAFVRYSLRMADHLESVAAAADYYSADSALFNSMLQALSPRHISFGKEPNTPVKELTELVKEIRSLDKSE